MRILAISDKESLRLWDYFQPRYLDGIDLILSAGDLDSEYLSFLATFSHAPSLFVLDTPAAASNQNPPGA